MGLLQSDLAGVASASIEVVKELVRSFFPSPCRFANRVSQPATETPGAISAPATKLASYEKKLSTLQLSLEILGEWCATLDADALGDAAEEEEWGGIPMEDGEEDVEMDEGDEGEDSGGADEGSMDEESASDAAVELSSAALTLFASLPSLLLALSTPTPLSFHVAPSTASTPGLIPTSFTSSDLPIPLSAVADLLTTIHVRALECLNNLYITLARAIAAPSGTTAAFLSDKSRIADLQAGWEGVLGMVQGALVGQTGAERKEDEGEDRRMEVVMAGVGAAWGMARVGLGEGGRLVSPVFMDGGVQELIRGWDRRLDLRRRRSSSRSFRTRSLRPLRLLARRFGSGSPEPWAGWVVARGSRRPRTRCVPSSPPFLDAGTDSAHADDWSVPPLPPSQWQDPLSSRTYARGPPPGDRLAHRPLLGRRVFVRHGRLSRQGVLGAVGERSGGCARCCAFLFFPFSRRK